MRRDYGSEIKIMRKLSAFLFGAGVLFGIFAILLYKNKEVWKIFPRMTLHG